MAAKKTTTAPKPPEKAQAAPANPAPPADPFAALIAVGDLPQSSKLKVLIYGSSGSGKSTLAARFPRPLIGLTELQGAKSILDANPQAKVLPIRNMADLTLFRRLAAHPETPKRFDAIVLDSLTDVQRLIKDFYTGRQKVRQDKTDMESWGLIVDVTAKLVRELRDRELHTVVICLDAEESVDGLGMVHRPAVFGKKLPNDLAQYMSAVAYLHKSETAEGKIHRTAIFEAGDNYITKSTSGLQKREPPEPQWWVSRAVTGAPDPDAETLARVALWLKGEVSGQDPADEAQPEATAPVDPQVVSDDPMALGQGL